MTQTDTLEETVHTPWAYTSPPSPTTLAWPREIELSVQTRPAIWIWRECGEMDKLRLPETQSDLRGISWGPLGSSPHALQSKPKVPDSQSWKGDERRGRGWGQDLSYYLTSLLIHLLATGEDTKNNKASWSSSCS